MTTERLANMVASSESWLTNRVLDYVRGSGYARRVSTLAESGHVYVNSYSESLAKLLSPSGDEARSADPVLYFGAAEARRHHAVGLTEDESLGIVKCYRQGYVDLVKEADWPDEDAAAALCFVDRFFDLVEAGVFVEWGRVPEREKVLKLEYFNQLLSSERDKYLTIFESLHEPAMLLDREGAVENLNVAATKLFEGFAFPSEVFYDGRCVAGPPASLLSEILLTAEVSGGTTVIDREVETHDGLRRFRVTARRTLDMDEDHAGTLVTLTDITEFEEAQDTLRQRGQLARLVSEISSHFVGIDASETDAAIEEALCKTATFTGADSGYAFRVSEDGRRFSMTHLWQSGRLQTAKDRLQDLDADTMPWWFRRLREGEVVAVASLDELPAEAAAEKALLESQGIRSLFDVPLMFQGQLIGFAGLASKSERMEWSEDELHLLQILGQVVTSALRRRRAEEALAQERQLLRTMIDHLPDYIFVKDAESRFVLSNTAHLHLMRTDSLDDIIGKTDLDMFPSTLAAGYRADEQRIIGSGEPLVNREETVIDERGHRRWLLTTKVPWRDHNGEVAGIVGMSRDITERKRMEEALAEHAKLLEQANDDLHRRNQDLDEFTYVASHDLQEPLRKLAAFSDLLREDLTNNDRDAVLRDLQAITSGAQRMQQLVQDLLALSRSGRQKMNLQPLSLDRCVDRALEALELRVRETGGQIVRQKLPQVRGDLGLLTQLYQNLIGNALKFHGDAPPRIELSAEQQDEGWLLTVADNGIGIKPEYAEQVFAPFRRLHGRNQFEGTGIGLAICRKIVERHGGQIWVESQLGLGARFRFTLTQPRQEEAS